MTTNSYPSLDEFLAAPIEQVREITPSSIIYCVGGTRRAAVLAGLSSNSDEYINYSRERFIECCDLLFCYGVQHIFMPALAPSNFNEIGRYRERLVDWVEWGLSGQEALADYIRLGWKVRLLGTDTIPRLHSCAERLIQLTSPNSKCTLWFYAITSLEWPWRQVLKVARQDKIQTQKDAIRTLYGEDIEPVKLFISFGKPRMSPTFIPPFLAGEIEMYWSQKPGFTLDDTRLRTILYDYYYLRKTWIKDKTGRAESALAHRDHWMEETTIGIGRRIGSFWYPEPISPT